jgi:hypothetical protein
MAERSVLSQLVLGPFRRAGGGERPGARAVGALPRPTGAVRPRGDEPAGALRRGGAPPELEALIEQARAMAAEHPGAEDFEEGAEGQGMLRGPASARGSIWPSAQLEQRARTEGSRGPGSEPTELEEGERRVPVVGPMFRGPLAGGTPGGRGERGVADERVEPSAPQQRDRAPRMGEAGERREERASESVDAPRAADNASLLVPLPPLRPSLRPVPVVVRVPETAPEAPASMPDVAREVPRGQQAEEGSPVRRGEARAAQEAQVAAPRGPARLGAQAPVRERGTEPPVAGDRSAGDTEALGGREGAAIRAGRSLPDERAVERRPDPRMEPGPAGGVAGSGERRRLQRVSGTPAGEDEPGDVLRRPAGAGAPVAAPGVEARAAELAEREDAEVRAGLAQQSRTQRREQGQPAGVIMPPPAPRRTSADEGPRAPRAASPQPQAVSIHIGRVEIRVKAPAQERATAPRAHQIQLDPRFEGGG